MNILEKKLGEDFIRTKLRELFYPNLRAISTDIPGWDATLLEENILSRELAARSGGMLSGLISKFLGSDEREEKEEKEKGGIFSWLAKRKANKEAQAKQNAEAFEIVIEDAPTEERVDGDCPPTAPTESNLLPKKSEDAE